jgi:hypothetical protein
MDGQVFSKLIRNRLGLAASKDVPTPTEWSKWNPGLDNEGEKLGAIYRTLPKYEFTSYPMIVLVLENPKSPVALKGKCDLLTHDLIHVLLGRGLFVQDEAFVIGYTMGTSRRIGGFEKELFKLCAKRLYPPKYRFTRTDLTVFDFGFTAGQANKVEIFDVPLAEMMELTIGDVRRSLKIDVSLLRQFYALEKSMFQTKASARLVPESVRPTAELLRQ